MNASSATAANASTITASSSPSITAYIFSFLLVGIAWGLTTPFIRRAALTHNPPARPWLDDEASRFPGGVLQKKIMQLAYKIADLVRNPRYAIPLLVNITGSLWFYVLVGGAELSLTVPITNSLAFLFTVLGEWWVDGKVISRNSWLGMAFVLGGIGLCVQSKL